MPNSPDDSTSATSRRIRGYRKLQLINELALGNKSQKQLAEEFGHTEAAISAFRKREAAAIQKVIDEKENEFAGLWIADQVNRIAEYESLHEYLQELVYSTDKLDTASVNAVLRMAQILRNVAEERGHLTQKTEASGDVRIEVVGVDTDSI